MKLTKLIERLEYIQCVGDLDKDITTLVYDSRKVEPGSVFVCISGTVRDAHDFIPDVIEKGASVIIVEKDVIFQLRPTDHCLRTMWFFQNAPIPNSSRYFPKKK